MACARAAICPSNSGVLAAKRSSNMPCRAFVEAPNIAFVQPVTRSKDLDSRPHVDERHEGSCAGIRVALPAKPQCARDSRRSCHTQPDIVLIHDAARPFASASLIARAIEAAEKTGAAIPALPVTDTVKRVDHSGIVEATARSQLHPPGANTASFRLPSSDCSASARCRTGPRAILPTTPRSPNGPA